MEVTSALRREVLSAYPDQSRANSSYSKTAADYYHYDDDGDGGGSSLSAEVFMPLSVALLVLCLVGSASAAAAACCTLAWTKKGTKRSDRGARALARRQDL